MKIHFPSLTAAAVIALLAAAPHAVAHHETTPPLQLAGSHKAAAKGMDVKGAFARASAGLAKNGAAYMNIHNMSGTADRLVGAKAEVAKRVELHTHKHEGGVMKMRKIDGVDVPATGMAMLKPGGDHVMFMGLHAPLKEGESFPLTLMFEKAGEVTVTVKVGKVGAKGPTHGGHGKKHGHGKKD